MDDFDKRTNPLDEISEKHIANVVRENYGLIPKDIQRFSVGTEIVAWLVKAAKGDFVVKIFGAKDDTLERL